MSSQRSSHQQKTIEERREYFRTTIRGTSPTLEELPPTTDSTDVPVDLESEDLIPLTKTKPESWLSRQFKEETVRTILIPLLILFIGWFGYQVYSLNREVGEIKIEIRTLQDEQKKIPIQIDKLEERSRREIDTKSKRIDRLEERLNSIEMSQDRGK